MNEEILNKLQEIFTPIAQKIGQGAEFGWEVILKQQYVIAIVDIIIVIGGILLAIATYLTVKYSIKKFNEDNFSSFDFVGVMVGVFGSLISAALIFGGLQEAITHFINPEYYALEFLINLTK